MKHKSEQPHLMKDGDWPSCKCSAQ